MKYILIGLLLACSVNSSIRSESGDTQPIVRWIHGLNAPCIIQNISKYFPGFDVKCIETGFGSFGSFDEQIATGCSLLDKEADYLSQGFTLVGFSQGGLIARGILQRCDIGKHVRRLVTIGGPHMGVAIVPFTAPDNFVNKILIPMCLHFPTSRTAVTPCGYIRSLRFYDTYAKSHNTVLDLNNELQVNPQYKERILGLELFMAIGFDNDQMIQPKNTAIFGFYQNKKYDSLVNLEQTFLYSLDVLGIKEFNESGRLFRCTVPGDHLQISEQDMGKLVADFSNIHNTDYKKNYDYMKGKCMFKH
jgi:palmitoyl-protein thioesterase